MEQPAQLRGISAGGLPLPWSTVLSESAAVLGEVDDLSLGPDESFPGQLVEKIVWLLREGAASGSITSAPSHRRRLREMLAFWAGILHLRTRFTVLAPSLADFSEDGEALYQRALLPDPALQALLDGASIEDCLIEAPHWVGVRIARMQLVNCYVTNAEFARMQLSGSASWSRTRLFESTLKEVKVDELTARDVFVQRSRVIDCELADVNFRGGIFNDVIFSGCSMPGARFVSAYLGDTRDAKEEGLDGDSRLLPRRVIFRNCDLRGSDFTFADLSGVVFENCNLDLANFSRSWMARNRFAGCTHEGAIGSEEHIGLLSGTRKAGP